MDTVAWLKFEIANSILHLINRNYFCLLEVCTESFHMLGFFKFLLLFSLKLLLLLLLLLLLFYKNV